MTDTINTIAKLRKAIKAADAVYMSPRFGCAEKYVKVSKVEVLYMIAHYNENDTPDDCEIGTAGFATWTDKDLFVG